jgi:hypothetical protein
MPSAQDVDVAKKIRNCPRHTPNPLAQDSKKVAQDTDLLAQDSK